MVTHEMQDAEYTRSAIMVALREATRTRHDAVEAAVDLTGRPLTMGRYRRLLRAFLGFYDPLEARLSALPDWNRLEPAPGRLEKSDWLRQDLLALHDAAVFEGEIERCQDLPDVADFGCAVGSLYVMEGATLGGRIVLQHVRNSLNLKGDKGCRFFTSYGTAVARRWTETCRFITTHADSPGAAPLIIRGACDTFDSLHRWFQSRSL
ncbi:MAG: biliverdin-producing heme oxygenase [Planctomyces sp.]|nr:biliverdin-producing heme oxygenase [Planctomyces sp.]